MSTDSPSDPTFVAGDSDRCAGVADLLVGIDEIELLGAEARTHVEQCLRCQAEAANYRRLRRTMRSLADQPVSVDSMLEHEIMVALDAEDGRVVPRVPRGAAVATLGGLAAAAGAIAIASRRRAS